MKISEIFGSPTVQGEGFHMGVPSVFIRLVGCSLRCQGFGQGDPTGVDIPWIDPLANLDTKKIKMIEDVPKEAYTLTCDSNWAWHPKFKHLFRDFTATEVVDCIDNLRDGMMEQIKNGKVHIVISGGDPLILGNQKNVIQILKEVQSRFGDMSKVELTFETNGIQNFIPDLAQLLIDYKINVTMSISPKLFTVAGETNEKAIKPDIIKELIKYGNRVSYLKFVMGKEKRQEEELLTILNVMPKDVMIYLMPVGKDAADIAIVRKHVAELAAKLYVRFSDRLHALIWDNEMGR